jgi:predicted DCC family thiol-disulfide oxidoreductase YuxK
MTATGSLLLYDGTCGLCAASVGFMLRHERRHTLRFATLDGSVGSEIRRRHPQLEGVNSMVWVDPAAEGHPERVLVRSAAALRTARYLGGPWRLLAVGRLLPGGVRDAIYDWIARHRHSLTARNPRCFVPAADEVSRFLDWVTPPDSPGPPPASLEDPGRHRSP